MSYPDISDLLHALRGRELRRMPAGAETILSAGCSGRWYFDWLRDNYPGIKRHLGIEAYAPMPPDLPPEAVWLTDYVWKMNSVPDNEVDLVFAGQTVEHLWPDELAGFLEEAHRVLRPGGLLVLDSPNQAISQPLNWYHTEHTMELTVNEARKIVELAGFEQVDIRGIWLCRDLKSGRLLPFVPDLKSIDLETDLRAVAARDHPQESFIWWLEARKDSSRAPDATGLRNALSVIFSREYPRALGRYFTQAGRFQMMGDTPVVRSVSAFAPGASTRAFIGDARRAVRDALSSLRASTRRYLRALRPGAAKIGFLRHGPYMPLRPGHYVARFSIALDPTRGSAPLEADTLVTRIDVCCSMGTRILAQKDLLASDLVQPDLPGPAPAASPQFVEHALAFELHEVAFGVEFRVYATGAVPLIVAKDVALDSTPR